MMTRLKILFIALGAVTLSACGSKGLDPNHAYFVQAQKEIAMKQMEQDRPIIRMKAKAGETITLQGVEEFSVYAQGGGGGNAGQGVQLRQYQPPRSQGLELANTALRAVGQAVPILAAGHAATSLADAVGKAANHGYQYIQAPQPNMTIGGNGVIGDGSFTSNDLGGSGVIGDGTYGTYDLSGTGSIGGDYSTVTNPIEFVEPLPSE